jgi:hypothetical protein
VNIKELDGRGDLMGGFDCIWMTGIFNVRFVHLTSHELSWHQNVKNVALQCENTIMNPLTFNTDDVMYIDNFQDQS